MKKAAGILFVSKKGNALFLQRSKESLQFPLAWCFPGGGTEHGETAEETAIREAKEELGSFPEGEFKLHTRTRTMEADGQGVATAPPPMTAPANVEGAPPVVPAASPTPVPEQVDFTTFIQRVDEEFQPALNEEHAGFAWAPIANPPEPLHPGCRVALERISMDELGVARAIMDGRLSSPQYYVNMWLFAIRITGTDVAYRNSIDEFVYRDPKLYLNEEFLARCNGLQVIYRQRSGKEGGFHPAGALLNPKEFVERVVGSIFLPYISNDEVWGIAKIYDAQCASDMEEGRASSTSPAVYFAEVSVNSKLQLEEGSTLLIEGKPTLLDHVCICEQGVWDKIGEPSGVRAEARGDAVMAEEHEAKKDAEEHKADADAGKQLETAIDAMVDAVKGLHGRMDAIEENEKKREDAHRKDAKRRDEDDEDEEHHKKDEDDEDDEDAERLVADRKKKDAKKKDAEEHEEKKEGAKKKDAEEDEEHKKGDSRGDAIDTKAVLAKVEEVRKLIPTSIPDADHYALTDSQARADEIYTLFGKRAPRPVYGDTVATYERRCVRDLKEHSPRWKTLEANSAAFADDASFAIIRDQVYADATITGRSAATVDAGTLRMVTRREGGHQINDFVGEPNAWMDQMAGPTRHFVTKINVPNG